MSIEENLIYPQTPAALDKLLLASLITSLRRQVLLYKREFHLLTDHPRMNYKWLHNFLHGENETQVQVGKLYDLLDALDAAPPPKKGGKWGQQILNKELGRMNATKLQPYPEWD